MKKKSNQYTEIRNIKYLVINEETKHRLIKELEEQIKHNIQYDFKNVMVNSWYCNDS